MAKIIGLPKLSPTMEEGVLVRWAKREGETVDVDELVAEVETDKAMMEFRSFDRGTLLKQLVEEGTTLEADQPVAIFGEKDEDIHALLEKASAAPGNSAASGESNGAESSAAPAPEVDLTIGRSDERRVLASPLVRRLARERDIDLRDIQGSGPRGRIIKRDLEAHRLTGSPAKGEASEASSSPSPSIGRAPASSSGYPTGDKTVKLSQMRKTIARRLTESKQTIPHFYLNTDVNAKPLVEARLVMNQVLEDQGVKVSLNDLIVKACAVALRAVPQCNASFLGDAIVYHERVDISIAVAVSEGLVTPVVRNADQKGVLAISHEIRELADRAKERKLKPDEMTRGTFSVSNLGMFGVDEFSAVINPPEGAILAVGRVREEAVVQDGRIAPGKRLALTLSSDHRVIDGAAAASFLKVLRRLVEQPLRMVL